MNTTYILRNLGGEIIATNIPTKRKARTIAAKWIEEHDETIEMFDDFNSYIETINDKI